MSIHSIAGSAGGEPHVQPSSRRYERFVAPYVQMGDFSGSILVVREGKILFRRDYGYLNYELRARHNPSSKFHIASISKTFTAAAVALLEREGKLALSDRLTKYIDDYPEADKITLTNLLAHSSGVPDYYALPEYSGMKRSPVSLDHLISIVKAKPLDFVPGTKDRYSNTGYAFLAHVVEKASGITYDRFVRERLLMAAGMKNSGIWLDEPLIPFRASGYQPWVGIPPLRNAPFYDKRILTGAGSLYSTADDLWAWCRFLRSQKLLTLDGSSYPYGWGLRKKDGRSYVEQNGRDPGFVSHMTIFPKEDLIVIVLGNVEVAADSAIADGLAAIALGGHTTQFQPRAKYTVNAESLANYAGRYEVAPNFVLDVVPARDHLFLRGTGGDFLPLDPTAKDRFFYRQLYVSVGFKRDESGKVTALLWGGDYACTRTGDVSPEAAEELRLAVDSDASLF